MAHGFLSYEKVSGDRFWQNAKLIKDAIQKLLKSKKYSQAKGELVKSSGGSVAFDGTPEGVKVTDVTQKAAEPAAKKMFAGSSTVKAIGAGTGSIAKQESPTIPGGNTGGISKKPGGSFTELPGVSAADGGLNAETFFKQAITGVGTSGEYLTTAQRRESFIKSRQESVKTSSSAAVAPPISPDSGVDIVAAVNRNTQMIVSLVEAVKAQTKNDTGLVEKQIQTQESLMLRGAAKEEEAALEQGSDLSGFMTPENFAKRKKNEEKKETGSKLKEFFRGPNSFKKEEGCGCSPFIPGPGGRNPILGGPPGGGGMPFPDYVGEYRDMNRRPGSRLGGGGSVTRRGGGGRRATRLATKVGGKGAGKAVAKGLGKFAAKKIPVLGALAGGAFAAERAMKGDWLGAGGELLSGIASIIPGIGTAVSTGIDAGLMARDAGLTPFASGGIITKPTAGLVGEAGNEGIFPLEGKRGEKTFRMFGEGVFQAQKDNDKDFAKLQSMGLKQYYEREGGFKKMGEGLKDFFSSLAGGIAALLGGPANAATGPGSGDYVGDPSITGDEKEYLMRLMIAEAGGQGDIGMAAVGRSVLNRAGLIQSGTVGAGTFNAKSGSIMDVINASKQYQPVAQGKLKRELSAEERKKAEAALAIAMNQADMRGRLEAKGLKSDQVNKLMAATGFRAGYAFDDPSQNVNVTKLGDHYFNTAGNRGLKVAGQVEIQRGQAHSPTPHGTGNAMFGETGRVSNRAGYVHGHFQTDTGSKADVVNDVAPMIRSLLNSGVTDVSITSGETFRKDMNDAQIRALIERGISKHTHSGGGKAVDIFVPKGTKVPFPLSDVRRTKGNENGGITGILPGSGKVWVGHLDPKSKSGGTKPKPSSEMANQPGQTSPAKPSPRASGRSPGSLQASAANPNTGTPMMATSQQVAMASMGGGTSAAPTVINNYYSGGGQSGGFNAPNAVAAGIGMDGTGTAVFQDLRIRALA